MSFENIEKVLVPSWIITKTCKFLQKGGEKGKEALSLWVGRPENNFFNIKDVLFPEQISNRLFFHVSDKELDKINRELYKKNLSLIAQIHSHPRAAFHSSIDEKYPIMTTLGGFSIVIPSYGFISSNNFHEYAVYRLTEKGWVEFTQKEVGAIFSIIK